MSIPIAAFGTLFIFVVPSAGIAAVTFYTLGWPFFPALSAAMAFNAFILFAWLLRRL